jgi:hypothetical protein
MPLSGTTRIPLVCLATPSTNRVEKARGIGISDDELNALIAVTAAVNSGVTAATARIAFGMLEADKAEECGDTCSPNPA